MHQWEHQTPGINSSFLFANHIWKMEYAWERRQHRYDGGKKKCRIVYSRLTITPVPLIQSAVRICTRAMVLWWVPTCDEVRLHQSHWELKIENLSASRQVECWAFWNNAIQEYSTINARCSMFKENYPAAVETFSIIDFSCCAGTTPDCRHLIAPFLKRISVGTDCTWYAMAAAWFLSTSTLMIFTSGPVIFANSLRIGSIILHGPHQVAEKSTSTVLPELMTSLNVLMIEASIELTVQLSNHLLPLPSAFRRNTNFHELQWFARIFWIIFFCLCKLHIANWLVAGCWLLVATIPRVAYCQLPIAYWTEWSIVSCVLCMFVP